MKRMVWSTVLICMLVACASGSEELTQQQRQEQRLASILATRVAGPAVHCISLDAVDYPEIVAGLALVYHMRDGTLFVNRPSQGADSLQQDLVLFTSTFTRQLCALERVQLIDPGIHKAIGSVWLADFVPYRKPS
jgi:uncharacterized lipoprotein YmbA